MAEPDKKQNFWTTLPGVLTGLAALLTAVTGFLVVMHPRDVAGGKEGPAVVAGPSDSGTRAPAAGGGTATSSSPSPAKQGQKPTVLVTGKDGTQTTVFLDGFKHWFTDEMINLTSGQSIPFDKVKSVDFLATHDFQRDVKVTLVDGRVVDGRIETGLSEDGFKGESDLGPFSISVANLRQITFER